MWIQITIDKALKVEHSYTLLISSARDKAFTLNDSQVSGFKSSLLCDPLLSFLIVHT
jgi:hypothetical protein